MVGGAVSWRSRLQTCVTQSTIEAEYVAASEACKEAIWLGRLVTDLRIKEETPMLHCDSQSAIQLARNPVYHSKTKHVDVKYHFIWEMVEDKQRFEGRDISKFCRLYEQSMEDNGIQDREAVDGFHLIVVPELRIRIVELQTQLGIDWPEFKKALKEEYFLEDSQPVTKQSFMKWINQKNKGLSTRELLREFEKKYEQLSFTEQRSIRSERVELFVQAVDARLQKSLVQLLEDATGDLGSTSDWKLVPEAVNMIVKRQMRVDKLIVADSSDTSDEESKDKPTSSKHKLEEPVLDDLVKGIQELNLNLKAVKLEGLGSKGSTSNRGCMWCDSKEHERQDCDDFKEAYRKNVVFWKDNKIHLKATSEPLRLNNGRGGMKKLAEEIQHNVALVDAATYDLQVYSKADSEDKQAYGDLWLYALKMARRGKVPRGKLSEAGNSIRETTVC
ncbi:hypothetical protein L7F22_020334 [Adiantum nelumboides]|nr:hypothetical protein [Adiantum nelumboides]